MLTSKPSCGMITTFDRDKFRQMWRKEKNEAGYDPEKPITRVVFAERMDTIFHTEKGTLHRICPASGEQRDMIFQDFEANRNTLK